MKFLPSLLSTLLILVAVLLPGSQIPNVGFGGIDKLAHFVLFFLWAVCVRRDFMPRFHWSACFIAGIAFSLLTEVLQIYVEDRTFDLTDIVADAVGLVCGIAAGGPLLRWIGRFVSPQQE